MESGIPALLSASAWLMVWILAFHGIGARVLGGYFPREKLSDIFLYKSFSIALGSFLLSVWLFVCGLSGLLGRPSSFIFLALGMVLCVQDKRRHGRSELRALSEGWKEAGAIERASACLLLLLAAWSFLGAQAPAIGNDDLAYHLYFPRLYAESGKLLHDASHERSLWPFGMEMLYTAGLLIQGAALAKLFSWMTAVLALIATGACAAKLFGRREALFSFLFAASVPAIWMQTQYAYVDNAMMLFTLLSLLSLYFLVERGYPVRGAFVAGLCAAALVSVKIYALVPCVLLGGLYIGRLFGSGRGTEKFRATAVLLLTAFVFGAGWYARSWALSGNPVFPFMADVFGGNGFSHRVTGFAELPKTPATFFLVPWNTALKVGPFGGEPLGALFLAALPLLFLDKRRGPFLGLAAFFSAAYLVCWYFTIQHVRFLFPLIPFLSVLSAHAVGTWLAAGRSRLKTAALCLGGSLFLIQAALGFYYPSKMFAALGSPERATAFLESRERTYALMRKVAEKTVTGDRILFVSEPRLYYSPVEAVLMGPAADRQIALSGLPFAGWMRREGITHILAASRLVPDPAPADLLSGHSVPLISKIFSAESADPDDRVHYAFYKIV